MTDGLHSVFNRAAVLPAGRVVHTPAPQSEKPQEMMVAFRIAPEVSGRYAQDDQEPLEDRHITLVYIPPSPADVRAKVHDVVRHWLVESDWQPMDGQAQGWGTFNNGKGRVLWMGWDIPGMAAFRTDLDRELRANGIKVADNHDFVPHETVAFVKREITRIPKFPTPAPSQTFSSVIVAEGDTWTEYDFPAVGSLVAALFANSPLMDTLDLDPETFKDKNKGDGNKGNAEELKKYWLPGGEGGAKIKWNTGGDHGRCVKHLKKYLGPGANGYCQELHKIATTMYTGDMKHRIMYGWGGKPGSYWAKKDAENKKKESSIWEAITAGGDEEALMLLLGGEQSEPQAFCIPLVLPEGVESGDGRTFVPDSVTWRDLPLPLLWQPTALQGHDGSMIVGRIDAIERVIGGVGNAFGVFDSSPMAQEAVRMIREGFLRGTSADLDMFEAKVIGKGPGTGETVEVDDEAAEKGKGGAKDGGKEDDEDTIANDKMDITKGRIMAVTLVAKPAFQQCMIKLVEPEMIEDGEYRVQIGAEETLAAVIGQAARASRTMPLTAAFGGAPIYPPQEWFNDPGLTKPSRIEITDDGRVFGHIAAWHVDHIGMGFGVRPPKSKSGYAYFRTGLVRTAEGEDVRVGQLTLVGGHASLTADVKQTVKHYDDTASAWADVAVGEDRHGIWVAGSLRPTVTPEILRAARASAVSGDWRPINGKLELVAVCSVNVPGFPLIEARVASGQVMALVAAGTGPIMQDWARSLTEMLLEEKADAARARMFAQTEIVVRPATIKEALLSKQPVSTERREKMAKSGEALPDDSYPIADEADLKRAIKAYGRSKPEDRAKVRKHIIKRAKALGKSALIPENWE